jgi:hypothetical protein
VDWERTPLDLGVAVPPEEVDADFVFVKLWAAIVDNEDVWICLALGVPGTTVCVDVVDKEDDEEDDDESAGEGDLTPFKREDEDAVLLDGDTATELSLDWRWATSSLYSFCKLAFKDCKGW